MEFDKDLMELLNSANSEMVHASGFPSMPTDNFKHAIERIAKSLANAYKLDPIYFDHEGVSWVLMQRETGAGLDCEEDKRTISNFALIQKRHFDRMNKFFDSLNKSSKNVKHLSDIAYEMMTVQNLINLKEVFIINTDAAYDSYEGTFWGSMQYTVVQSVLPKIVMEMK